MMQDPGGALEHSTHDLESPPDCCGTVGALERVIWIFDVDLGDAETVCVGEMQISFIVLSR